MARERLPIESISRDLLQNIEKYGTIMVRVGDVLEEEITYQKGTLDPERPITLYECSVVNEVEARVRWFSEGRFLVASFGDRDPYGEFTTGGCEAVMVDTETLTAEIPRVRHGLHTTIRMVVVGHAETKEEYLKFRDQFYGYQPVAGNIELRGTPQEIRPDQVGPIRFSLKGDIHVNPDSIRIDDSDSLVD